jgi:hypothetical protein
MFSIRLHLSLLQLQDAVDTALGADCKLEDNSMSCFLDKVSRDCQDSSSVRLPFKETFLCS